MGAKGFTHVSVSAHELEESARFYREMFAMEEVPAPDFPFPVRWLRVGNLQLHLFQSDDPTPRSHHFGLDVDDFEAAYRKAEELGAMDEDGYYANVYELPDGAAQLYVRDPAGNMVEINHPDAGSLDRSVVGEIREIGGDAALYMPSEKKEVHRG